MDPLVSVIVPSYNAARTIRRCLSAIVGQRTSVPFDVTVVDSSSDDTPGIVAREFPSVRLIHLEARAASGVARNIGLRATRAPYCLLIDADCVARSDVLERMVARHRAEPCAAVSGAVGNGTPRSPSGWIGYLAEFKEVMPSAPRRLVATAPTAVITYRRAALERFALFDERVALAADTLLSWQVTRAGERILFDPAIHVTHLNRTGGRAVLSHQVRLGRAAAVARRLGGLPGAVLLRHPALIVLMPFARTWWAAAWLARHDLRGFAGFLVVWPLYLLAMTFWSVGFFREATRRAVPPPPVG